ncbi:hypothetical protein FB45DRAFT_179313 [Roridomyces roridus]|uniref:MYND-type domain-containing protein n=1 Tax=Roridomyces roridus TaxID=1738132 RepID=A0AAD7CEC0_9AGAR|nr:hypothetical protein FB45DRAFT_179313 [Roridomyces roridus]
MEMDAATWVAEVCRENGYNFGRLSAPSPKRPTAVCANASCTSGRNVYLDSTPQAFEIRGNIICSGCEGVRYCSYQCQVAAWALQHQVVCAAPLSVALSGIHLRVWEQPRSDDSDEEEDEDHGRYYTDTLKDRARKTLKLEIMYTDPKTNRAHKVGHVIVEIIKLALVRGSGFHESLDGYSRELARLSAEFDSRGRISANNGCWQPGDFDGERRLVYLEEFIVDVPWRGKGIGGIVLPMLFELTEVEGARFIFSWPTVLDDLEPRASDDGFTDAEQATLRAKCDRIIAFYRRAGFRRLINSHFFCLAKDNNHASHSVPADEDAPYQEPPELTDEELLRMFSELLR